MPRNPSQLDSWQPTATDILNVNARMFKPVTPHWGRVTPFALERPNQFMPPPPAAPDTAEFEAQIDDLLHISANLTEEQKATAEYWANFISQPPSQLMALTKYVSLRDDYRLDDDVKLFFTVSNALLDAGIAAWDCKYHYDYVRPYTAIRRLGDRPVVAWDNPNRWASPNHLPNSGLSIDWGHRRGNAKMPAKDWLPYLPTPPFPEYVSGHSTFTAAWAVVMQSITGSPRFGFQAKWKRSFIEDRTLDTPVVLSYPTFWSAAGASGISRLYAGIHWPAGNREGLKLGRQVGETVWAKAQSYFSGQASPFLAASIFLAPPLWHHSASSGGTAPRFEAASGLAIQLNSEGATGGAWRSMLLDPLPAGKYRLFAAVRVASGQEAVLDLKLSILCPVPEQQVTLATVTDTYSGGMGDVMMPIQVEFQSDGHQVMQIEFEAAAKKSRGTATLSHLSLSRMG
jgi:membrane-associated phospholipid phosphatase